MQEFPSILMFLVTLEFFQRIFHQKNDEIIGRSERSH